MRRSGLALALVLVACGGEVTPAAVEQAPAVEPPPLPSRPARPAVDEDGLRALMDALGAMPVRHDAPVRTELFTWTTREQADELAMRPVLLSRAAADSGERSRFDVALERETNPVATWLKKPGQMNRRFAWSNPWATVMGWNGEGYGPTLVRVVLKPEAIVAAFTPGEPWRYFDAAGAKVAAEVAEAQPERLAAVYHVAPPEGERPGYREVVLVQEAMIDHWSVGTDEVRGRITAEAALMTALADKIDALRSLAGARCEARGVARCPEAELPEGNAALASWSAGLIAGPWAAAPPAADLLLADLYAAALAIASPAYVPNAMRVRAIALRLRGLVEQPPPFVVRPDLVDIKRLGPAPRRRVLAPSRCQDLSFGCRPPRGG